VLITERILLHGLELRRGKVDYGKVDAGSATEIFIRQALLEDNSPVTQPFYMANLRLCRKLEAMLARSGKKRTQVVERLYDFYREHLKAVSSIHDLSRIVKDRLRDDPHFLRASEADLTPEEDMTAAAAMFPDKVNLGNSVLPLHYSYNPGHEHDGVTIQVPLDVAQHLTSGQVQWLVPGMRGELAGVLLRALPKPQRRKLMPMEAKIADIAQNFTPGNGEFLTALATYISRNFDVQVCASDWPADSLPDYLKPRVEVIDQQRQTVASGRDVGSLRAEVQRHEIRTGAWAKAVEYWSKPDLRSWSFGDLPESVFVETLGGVDVHGYPGLSCKGESVGLQLFKSKAEAEAGMPAAVRKLAEWALGKEIAWVHKELRAIQIPAVKTVAKSGGFHDALGELGRELKSGTALSEPTTKILQDSALEHLLQSLLKLSPLRPLTAARFDALIAEVKSRLTPMARQVEESTKQILTLRRQIIDATKRYPYWELDLQRLVPPDFLAKTPHSQLQHLPRYLKAMLIRGERAHLNLAKDTEKLRTLLPFKNWRSATPPQNIETIRWLMEEFRVSIFAPELGTAQPVSAKRIEALMEPI
jgi:ATP-dependent helicase HrpA